MASLPLQARSITHCRVALNTRVLSIFGSMACLWSTFYSGSHPFCFKGLSIGLSSSVDTEIVGLLDHSRGGASIAFSLNARETFVSTPNPHPHLRTEYSNKGQKSHSKASISPPARWLKKYFIINDICVIM